MIYLLLQAYAFVHGITNAYLYSRKGAEALEKNEHEDLVIERCLACALALAGMLYALLGLWLLVPLELVAGGAAFSWWHNGSYNVMRAKINGEDTKETKVFAHHWRYQSPTSTAKNELSYTERTLLLWLSLGGLAIAYAAYFLLR